MFSTIKRFFLLAVVLCSLGWGSEVQAALSREECLNAIEPIFVENQKKTNMPFTQKNLKAVIARYQPSSNVFTGNEMLEIYHTQQKCSVNLAFELSRVKVESEFFSTKYTSPDKGEQKTTGKSSPIKAVYNPPQKCKNYQPIFLLEYEKQEKMKKSSLSQKRVSAVPTQVLAQELFLEYMVFRCHFANAIFDPVVPQTGELPAKFQNKEAVKVFQQRELQLAENIIEGVLDSYDHFSVLYTLHMGFQKVIDRIVKWNESLKPMARQLSCFPAKFINAATDM